MNWQKWGGIIAVVGPLIGATWWFSQNVVLAESYHEEQLQQMQGAKIRWLMHDSDKLWRDFQTLKTMQPRTPMVSGRMSEIERRMKQVDAQIGELRK